MIYHGFTMIYHGFTMDLPIIPMETIDLPWKPWIYLLFQWKVVVFWRLLIISRWIIRSCGDLAGAAPERGKTLFIPCVGATLYHVICEITYIYMFIWIYIYTYNIHTVHMSIHTYIH